MFFLPFVLLCIVRASAEFVLHLVTALVFIMPPLYEPGEVIALVLALIVLLLNIQDALQQAVRLDFLNAEDPEALGTIQVCYNTLHVLHLAIATNLHCFCILNCHVIFPDNFGL